MTGARALGALTALALALVAVWWFSSAPPDYFVIGPPVDFGGVPSAIEAVEVDQASFERGLERLESSVPGHDDILLQHDESVAFVPGMDGWIWRVNLDNNEAERLADVPLMPSGMRWSPTNPALIYFCASHLYGEPHREGERVGLYQLDLEAREVSPVVLDVPATPPIPVDEKKVFRDDDPSAPTLSSRDAGAPSRPLAFCNDLDVSADGRRLYFTEPIAYEGASMGGGAVGEAITLGNNGRLWRHDLDTSETRLVADGFHFIDGVLVEPAADGGREASVLVTNTPGFSISRYVFQGPRAGTAETLWSSLPGMPDGMDRDSEGRIWVGLYRKRSGFLTWAHKNPWIKPLMLRLPLDLLPVPKQTGILGLSRDGATPIYYAMYEGPLLTDAAVVVPGERHLYIANFDREQHGLVRLPYPDGTEDKNEPKEHDDE